MTIALPERSSHWYRRDGTPCHTVPTADGKGVRCVNLRWDRPLNLLPSVTNILSVKAKPGLDSYKIEQALMAAVTLPRIEGETEDEFMERVVVDMGAHQNAASAFGTKIHKYCEDFHILRYKTHILTHGIKRLKGDVEFCGHFVDPELEPYVADYKRWFSENVKEALWTEKVLVNEKVGYAGTADLLVRLEDDRIALVDLKTQGIKSRVTKTKGTIKNDPEFYPEWECQLVSYGKCLAVEPDALMSIVIDSISPGQCHIKEWPLAGRRNAWRSFLACHFLFCASHNYWPSSHWQ